MLMLRIGIRSDGCLRSRINGLTYYSRFTVRFNSTTKPGIDSDDNDKTNTDKNVPVNKNENFNHLTENLNPDLSSKVSRPSGSLASMDPSLQALMNQTKVQYNPALNKNEDTYQFHAPKTPKQLFKESLQEKSKKKSKLFKMLPSILIAAGLSWGVFTYYYLTNKISPNVDNESSLLKDDMFLPYIISFKHQIDENHYLIELTRKNRVEKLLHSEQLFGGDKLWSIEIMQPDINIVRDYTPLPMYVAGIDPISKEPHLRLIRKLEEEGKFVIIVKKYSQGEFSRWLISRNLLDEIRVRGPIIEYKFPYHPLNRYQQRPQMGNTLASTEPDSIYPENIPKPENYVFYGAGTGILPLIQLLYSPNPPRGFIEAYLSLHNESELLPQLKTLNLFAEKCGRAKFHYLISENGDRLNADCVKNPTLPNFSGALDLKVSEEIYKHKLLQEKREEVKKQITLDETSKINDVKSELEGKKIIFDDSIPADTIPSFHVDTKKLRPDTAYQQWNFFRTKEKFPLSSFAFVCGPEGYISYVSGKPDMNNLEMKDVGPVGGLLKQKGWTSKNIKRLQ